MFPQFYDWQKEFIKATHDYSQCCLIAANRIGKTFTGTYMDAIHALGDYPDDWEGHRFSHAPTIWCLGYSGEKIRDLLQNPIVGRKDGDKMQGGGLIPLERITGYEAMTGTANALRTVFVQHKSGGTSVIQFWSYSQGQHALMGDAVDWYHIDEEPQDTEIFPQVLTRTADGDKGNGGRGILTFTPENGRTDLVIQFIDSPSMAQFCMQKGWDDAPHLGEKIKTELIASYPAHQRDMRTKGIPMLGHGRIYDLAEEDITCKPFPIPKHFFVIDGMDFGWDHPQAQIQLVWDKDLDIFYVTRAWKKSQVLPSVAWGAVKSWAEHVPTAWPADGLQTEKGSAKQQKSYYVDAGFNMLPLHATWPDGSNGVEAGLFEIRDLMMQGKFKVFEGLRDWFDEFLQYHRDDKGKIYKVKDDLMDACFAPETLVMTPSGNIRIDAMMESGEVCGINGGVYSYTGLGVTKRSAELIAVHLNDGSIVRCTKEHQWLTDLGWMRADCLYDNIVILTNKDSICQRSLNSKPGTIRKMENTGKAAVYSCIGQYGHQLMEKFQKAITFTTSTIIQTTMILVTFNAWMVRSIFPCTTKVNLKMCQRNVEKDMTSGRTLLKGLHSKLKWVREMLLICGLSRTNQYAPSVSQNTWLKLNTRNSAPINVNQKTLEEGNQAKLTGFVQSAKLLTKQISIGLLHIAHIVAPIRTGCQQKKESLTLRVLRVESAGKSDVYCMSVADVESFALASGAIVHNCRYAYMMRRLAIQYGDIGKPKVQSFQPIGTVNRMR